MRPIPNFKGYSIDKQGQIFSEKSGRVLSPYLHFSRANLYKRVTLCVNGKPTKIFVHRLVALAYIGKRPAGLEVNHKDGDSLNNHYSNLEYVTPAQNAKHRELMEARRLYGKAA
jgi:hypothetical protein